MPLISRIMKKIYRKLVNEDPLVLFSKLLAINPPNRCGRIYAGTCCLISILLAIGAGCYISRIANQWTYPAKAGLWLQLVLVTIMYISDLVTVLIWPSNFRPPTRELKNIEASLSRFGFLVDDRTLRMKLGVFAILLSFGQPVAFCFVDIIKMTKGTINPYQLIHLIHYVTARTLINASEFIFVNYLYMIKIRFKELNRIINDINHDLVSSGSILLNRFEDERIRYRLYTLKKAHLDLTQIAKQVNKSFGFHLLIFYTLTTVQIVERLYRAHESIVSQRQTVVESFCTNFPLIGYYVAGISLVTLACYFTCAEAKKTAYLIHVIPIKKISQELHDEILHFSLQIQQHQLSFTAAGFFEINLSSFASVSSTIVSYLLVMVQVENFK